MTTNTNIPEPDPVWDYCQIWDSLQKIKAKIDVALEFMSEQEYASLYSDQEIKKLLAPASNKLIEIVNDVLIDDKE
ncbi:hypothetical protein [Nostoc sp. UHCC 0251]|uniref:hypothetical protein n=1 Tax=Nostoc sp. UHCC 0251 TaxID=3110240 RepID=UPI002B217517|nr:hypothetical protein [Nostoc sp. UHCC 0251]MEA5626601.1 hypothetical protein [Nostoc sp. UHCC 0251]